MDTSKLRHGTRWLVLSRPECSLCDTMLVALYDLLGAAAADIQVQDISGDATLERKYGQRLPVLLINDECVCAYRLDMERVRPYLAGSED